MYYMYIDCFTIIFSWFRLCRPFCLTMHQLMTPDWIHSNFIITGPFTLYPQYYEIPASTVANQQTLQLQLISPGILSSTDGISVTITVAMDTEVAQGDHDPKFGISDGK